MAPPAEYRSATGWPAMLAALATSAGASGAAACAFGGSLNPRMKPEDVSARTITVRIEAQREVFRSIRVGIGWAEAPLETAESHDPYGGRCGASCSAQPVQAPVETACVSPIAARRSGATSVDAIA